jgi:hypothetical protein
VREFVLRLHVVEAFAPVFGADILRVAVRAQADAIIGSAEEVRTIARTDFVVNQHRPVAALLARDQPRAYWILSQKP